MIENQNLKVLSLNKVKKDIYNVVINDTIYEFNEDTVLKYRLVKGKEIINLKEVLDYDNKIKYLAKIRNYVIKYPKSIYNLKEILISKYLDIDVNYIIDILIKEGFVDDKRYAKNKALSLISKNYGLNYIKNYLLYKEHISIDIVDEILESLDFKVDFNDLLNKLKKQKYDKQKAYNYLIRKGFNYNDFKDILNKIYS